MPAALTEALLQAFDSGENSSPGERGLILLGLAAPSLAEEDRESLTVGRRDAILIDLFERLFGDVTTALALCPSCGEQLEFDVPLADIRIPTPADRPDRFKLCWSGHEIAYRLPQTRDLAALGAEPGHPAVAPAARSLAERCILPIDDSRETLRGLRLLDRVGPLSLHTVSRVRFAAEVAHRRAECAVEDVLTQQLR